MKIQSLLINITLTSFIIMGLMVILPQAKVSGAFNGNLLADDAIFNNFNSMNATQIDAFLNTQSTSCISPNSGFEAKIPNGYTPSGGFTYGNFTSAGQIIATSAQVYGLNPQVLITTLEKEQSLVTGRSSSTYCNNGDENKYAAATGYGCPDNITTNTWTNISLYRRNGVEHTSATTCVTTKIKAGFSQQVIRAAWLLKFSQQRSLGNIGWAVIIPNWDNSDDIPAYYSGYMTQGTFKRSPSDTPTFYDGYATIDATSIHIDSGATASLYRYTPHLAGNKNFVSLFEGWFGFTYTTAPYAWSIDAKDAYIDSSMSQKFTDTNTLNLQPGEKAYLKLRARNMGNKVWNKSLLKLGTDTPHRLSVFEDPSWPGRTRPAQLIEASVNPNQVGTFEFTITAPLTTGTYRENFNLLAEGIAWMQSQNYGYEINVSTRAIEKNTKSKLNPGDFIKPGNNILSRDTKSILRIERNGNLVLRVNYKTTWETNTGSSEGTKLIMQGDGNLVLYSNIGTVIWNTATNGNPGAYLTLQIDGNLVVKSTLGTILWSSNTAQIPDLLDQTTTHINNTKMFIGQSMETANRKYRLALQTDGNLVLYSTAKALWATYTTMNKNASYLALQSDGNLVIYDNTGKALWDTHTTGNSLPTLTIQSDGNLVMYSNSGKPIWQTKTYNN